MSTDVHRFFKQYKSQLGSSFYGNGTSYTTHIIDGIRSMGVFTILGLILYIISSYSGFNETTYESPYKNVLPNECVLGNRCEFALIADLDQSSKMANGSFKSVMKLGVLSKTSGGKYEFEWSTEKDIYGKYNEGGRGMELSELVYHNGSLWTADDRTGIVFELMGDNYGKIFPRFILAEGDGSSAEKGLKIEWMTSKNGSLFVGSFGKEFVDPKTGAILSEGNLWVVEITNSNNVIRHDWRNHYRKLQNAVGCPFPGYLIHEAVQWSSILKKWVFLPRRVSKDKYDEVLDETRGSNIALIVSENFDHIEIKYLGSIHDKARGFSSFKFIPGTKDTLIVALKSVEYSLGEIVQQKTYVSIYNIITGEVLVDETEVPSNYKFEGIEFISNQH